MSKPKLFLIPFAGGNCYSFQFLLKSLKGFEVIVLELPGRGMRIEEDLLTDFDIAVKDILNQITSEVNNTEFIIYGHSLGALLALKVTEMLNNVKKSPSCIIVSGNAGPGIERKKEWHLLNKQDFIKELQCLGGIPKELLDSKELFNFFEPILRADFKLYHTNNLINQENIINTPICAIMGNQEENVEKISNWSKFTTSKFKHEVLEGNHFFIHRHPNRVGYIIKRFYDQSTVRKHS